MLMGERGLFEGYVTSVLPYLTPEQIVESQAYLCTLWTSERSLLDSADSCEFYFARCSVCIVKYWNSSPVGPTITSRNTAITFTCAAFGLALAVPNSTRRLKVELRTVRTSAWLACTEYEALDVVRDSVLKADNRSGRGSSAGDEAARGRTSAPYMLEGRLDGKTLNLGARVVRFERRFRRRRAAPCRALGSGRLAEVSALDYRRGLNRLGKTRLSRRISTSDGPCRREKPRQEIVNRGEGLRRSTTRRRRPSCNKPSPRSATQAAQESLVSSRWPCCRCSIGDRRLNDGKWKTLLNVPPGACRPEAPVACADALRHVDRRSRDEACSPFRRGCKTALD